MRAPLQKVTRVASTRSGRSALWAMVGQVATLVASMANFFVLARVLGPASYGMVAGSLALVLTIGPLAGLGAEKLVQRDIATRPDVAASALTTAILTVALGSVVTAAAISLLSGVVLPQAPLALLLALVVAELLASNSINCTIGSHFASGSAAAGALTQLLLSTAKITAVGAFWLTGSQEPTRWALLYAACALTAAVTGAAAAFRRFGPPVVRGYRPLARAREGLPYSANVTATIAQNDVDKTLLVRSGFAEEAGLYSAAYRLATMAWIPVLAVLQSMLPRFFAEGHRGGIAASSSLARRLAPPLLGYALAAAIGLAVVAPLVPWVLGDEYRDTVGLLVLLAPLALFKVAQYVPSEALTGAGRQSTRTACVVASMATNITLNIILIPRHGLAAALVATLVAESLYVVLVNVALRRAVAADRAAAGVEVDVR